MVIKDIEKEGLILFIEKQNYMNKTYLISKSYCPKLGIDTPQVRISISSYSEDINSSKYEEVHGIDFSLNEIKSFLIYNKKNGSTTHSEYSDNNYEYYDEVMSSFNELINSGDSEFTSKAITILSEINTKVK